MSARLWLRAVRISVRSQPAPVLLLTAAAGWAAMAAVTTVGGSNPTAHTGHGAAHAVPVELSAHTGAIWLAMVLAMGPALLLRETGRLWRGSLRRNRRLTMTTFLGGYALVWMLLGVVAIPLAQAVGTSVGLAWLVVALVAGWHCSPQRQRALNRCHRAPVLRVFGATAQWDAWRFGVAWGAACAASCGPAMLLVLLAADHHLVAMSVATILLTVERYLPPRRPRWQLPLVPDTRSGLPASTSR